MTTQDPRLDRLVQFDERSRDYPILAAVGHQAPRSYTWRCDARLDQGREGACVGFAWAHEIAARPKPRWASTTDALRIYREAQKIDEWPGEGYSGTSVIAGAKVVMREGRMAEYRWGFGLMDVLVGVSRHGPAVLGLPWRTGMYQPDEEGYIHNSGDLVGGHAILCNGVSTRRRAVRLHNSWGPGWGQAGECWMSWWDLETLLNEQGEACFPVRRK